MTPSQHIDLGAFSEDYRILKQKIEIKKIDVYRIEYLYNKKEYEFYVWSKDNVHCFKNPILEIAEDFMQQGKTRLEEKKYVDAYYLFEKSVQMYPDKSEWQELLNKTRTKIIQPYYWGGISGSLLFGFLLPFGIINLFTSIANTAVTSIPAFNSNFTANGVIVGGSLISLLIGIIISLIFHKKVGLKMNKNSNRLLYPFYISTVASIITILVVFGYYGVFSALGM